MGDFNTQLPRLVIFNRVGFPVSIKTTPYTAASKGAGTQKNGDKYRSLHASSFLALIIRSFWRCFLGKEDLCEFVRWLDAIQLGVNLAICLCCCWRHQGC